MRSADSRRKHVLSDVRSEFAAFEHRAAAARFRIAAHGRSDLHAGTGSGSRYIPTDRSILVYIILSFVTCGIYGFYFVYSIARDLNIMCSGDGENTPGLAAYIALSIVTCGIYNLWWVYKIGNRLAANAPRYGMQFQENGTTVLMWYIIGILLCGLGPWIGMYIIIKNTNMLAAAYNNYATR